MGDVVGGGGDGDEGVRKSVMRNFLIESKAIQ